MITAMAAMREQTEASHADIDRAFGSWDLSNRDDYCAFLLAHARALPAAESILATVATLPPIRPRTPLLAADLVSLGLEMPVPLSFDQPRTAAGVWGVLYVVEGSRLGGGVLAKRVPAAWPAAYLNARHLPGAWSALGKAINAEADRNDAAWLDDAVAGARACFALYHRACLPHGNDRALAASVSQG